MGRSDVGRPSEKRWDQFHRPTWLKPWFEITLKTKKKNLIQCNDDWISLLDTLFKHAVSTAEVAECGMRCHSVISKVLQQILKYCPDIHSPAGAEGLSGHPVARTGINIATAAEEETWWAMTRLTENILSRNYKVRQKLLFLFRGRSPQANYTGRATAACRRS
jgi:hypothetical protein